MALLLHPACLTLQEPEYDNGKTIVVMAGYTADMHKMLESNPGLKSRFTEYIDFPDWNEQTCVNLVTDLAEKSEPRFEVSQDAKDVLTDGFAELSEKVQGIDNDGQKKEVFARPGWANARDAIRMFHELKKARCARVATRSKRPAGGSRYFTKEDARKAADRFKASRPRKSAILQGREAEQWSVSASK